MKKIRIILLITAYLPLFLMGIEAGNVASSGFAIDLPSDWKTQTGEEFSATFLGARSPDGIVLRISSAPGTISPATLLPMLKTALKLQHHPKTEILEKKCRFCGMDGTKLVFTTGDGYKVDYFLLPSKERLYTVIFVTPPGIDSGKTVEQLMGSMTLCKPLPGN